MEHLQYSGFIHVRMPFTRFKYTGPFHIFTTVCLGIPNGEKKKKKTHRKKIIHMEPLPFFFFFIFLFVFTFTVQFVYKLAVHLLVAVLTHTWFLYLFFYHSVAMANPQRTWRTDRSTDRFGLHRFLFSNFSSISAGYLGYSYSRLATLGNNIVFRETTRVIIIPCTAVFR